MTTMAFILLVDACFVSYALKLYLNEEQNVERGKALVTGNKPTTTEMSLP